MKCYCKCICHTPAREWLRIIETLDGAPLPTHGEYVHGVSVRNGECTDCVRDCNRVDHAAPTFERDPVTPELVAENASPDPMADWSENERAYAFGDR
jgi:hypothetical protein